LIPQLEQSLIAARFEKEAWKNITSFNWKPFTDPDLKRKFKLLSVLGPSALPEGKLTQVKLAFQNKFYLWIGGHRFCFTSTAKQLTPWRRFTARPKSVPSPIQAIAE
jgi:hypothetical protein